MMRKFLDYVGLQILVSKLQEYIASANYTKTEVDDKMTILSDKIAALGSVLNLKETVATFDKLPASGNEKGDVRHVTANSAEYVWDGTSWEELGTTVDLSNYLTKPVADATYATAAQGAKADTALQPEDLSEITEDEINSLF